MAGDRGESTAHLCMLVIGIGYLFPISAIWAAFDYWKVLFPDSNIEFMVTQVYQVGSVATVAVLSLSQSLSLGPRILGGFGGQFACLGAILCFRWLTLASTLLLDLLLLLVLLCSIATGYLDSALLALCSQYAPDMQQSLQIGIGFGTLVSVLYRDLTKLLMAGDVADATSIYFGFALATVLVCIMCYKILMSLPISRAIRGTTDGQEALLGSPSSPPRSPLPYGYAATPLLDSPNQTIRDDLEEEVASLKAKYEEAQNGKPLDGSAAKIAADTSFKTVWRAVWRNQTVIFLNLFLTTLCYPGLITSIPCRQLIALRAEHWFQTLLLTVFTLADIVGRFLTHKRFGLSHANIYWTVLVRVVVFPAMFLCVVSPLTDDTLAFIVVGLFGLLNGYCVSLSLIVINEVPNLSDEQRKSCGRISACSVNGGLFAGAAAAAALATVTGITG